MAVGMASGEVALDHGWVREDAVRAALNAIEQELALAMRPRASWPAVACCGCACCCWPWSAATFAWRMGCGVCGPRCGGRRRRLPDWRRRSAPPCDERVGVAMDVVWDLVVFLALVAVGLVVLNLLARRR
jgi:hypothetical protein